MMRTRVLLGLLIAVSSASGAEQQQEAASAELLSLDRHWQEAVVTGDAQ